MGRDTGELQLANINDLLDEHARLAYHSARAADPDFQLDLHLDFDREMGELEVIPQDLGRVFLNMVSNSCYATSKKRREDAAVAEKGGPYIPSLWLTTRRAEDHAKIRIRDNGNGIPSDVIYKIFNPFFTTKPPDQGTGLGLAMSSDIVRRHSGTIHVESKPGQFTQMTIELPLVPPSAAMEKATPEMEAKGDTDYPSL